MASGSGRPRPPHIIAGRIGLDNKGYRGQSGVARKRLSASVFRGFLGSIMRGRGHGRDIARPLGADQKSGQNSPENRCRTTIAERMVETLSGTALYRDQVVCLSHDQAALSSRPRRSWQMARAQCLGQSGCLWSRQSDRSCWWKFGDGSHAAANNEGPRDDRWHRPRYRRTRGVAYAPQAAIHRGGTG